MNKEIKKLAEEIRRHKDLYYQGRAEISDEEFDYLEAKLREIDPENEILKAVGSAVSSNNKVEHARKMLSLNKTYKIEELIKWIEGREVVSTFKIDGSSCSLIYQKGKLVLGKTRGDGSFGEDISSKIKNLKQIPKNIINDEDELEVRGEIFITETDFFALSEEMQKRGLEKPNSQRNIVAGILGRKENIDLASFLSFYAFELYSDEKFLTEEKKFQKLQVYGFQTPEYLVHKTQNSLQEAILEAQNFISEGDYLIDGLVLSFNDLKLHDTLGETAHHPRYKMAFKFQGETKETLIQEILWQVSRNGILTPVASVEPVVLSGATVSRVTLHNFGLVKQFELKAKDKIEIVRSGEVIPKFLRVVESSQTSFSYPEICPSCGEKVSVVDIRLLCENPQCPDKIKEEILNFIHKIGIDDLSSKRLEEMIKRKMVTDIPSLYDLTEEKLLTLDKVKEKLASKIIHNIQITKIISLPVFLSALGISGGAINKCQKIVDNGFDSIMKIKLLDVEKLMQIESFAEKSATEFIRSLDEKRSLIDALLERGFEFKKEEQIANENILGKKFCITGTLSMKRGDIQKLIKLNGGINVSSVTKETDYLVTNDTESTSSKFVKAKELNIPILNEEKLLKLIG